MTDTRPLRTMYAIRKLPPQGGTPVEMIEKRDEARRLAAKGKPLRQIARELDVPPMTIHSWVPKPHEQSQFRTMADLRAEGLTNVEIAEKCGVNPKRVSAVLGPIPRRRVEVERRQMKLAPGTYDRLKAVARRMGLHPSSGERPRDGSVGYLLDAIARDEVVLAWREGFGPNATAPEGGR